MNVDHPGAIPMWVPDHIMFWHTDATWLVFHKTAGFQTPEECAQYFQAGSDGRNASSHYIIGLDGRIVQCVPEYRGAGANCCPEAGHAPFLPMGINMNVKTISVELIDPDRNNRTTVPHAQAQALFVLAHGICMRHNIPMRPGDRSGGILAHSDIEHLTREHCPGNFPWGDLYSNLKETHMPIPTGWHDDAVKGVLTAPNGKRVVKGFRKYILDAPVWRGDNIPLEEEVTASPLLLHNTAVGAGTRQLCQGNLLIYTPQIGVVNEAQMGREIAAAYAEIARLTALVTSLQPPAKK